MMKMILPHLDQSQDDQLQDHPMSHKMTATLRISRMRTSMTTCEIYSFSKPI